MHLLMHMCGRFLTHSCCTELGRFSKQGFCCCPVLLVQLTKSISDKHEEVMARMGSIMAAGILDAGALVGLR
jgi:hypothetical protein